MNTPALDVIIETYNKATVLPLTLTALFAQQLPAAATCRLLLCDDGSTDATRAVKITTPPPKGGEARPEGGPHWEIVRLPGPHKGAAAARNRGLQHAKADLILFLGADILLRPGAVAAHLNWHAQHPAETNAALGGIVWDPRLKPSPLMEWMMHGGPQNNFDALLGEATADPAHFFYGAHLSLKRAFIKNNRFDESFKEYGWEDLEFGRRLAHRGLTLYPLLTARALHSHRYTVADIARRQRLSGAALNQYQLKYPTEIVLPPQHGIKHLFRVAFIVSGGAFVTRQLVRLAIQLNLSFPRLFQFFTTIEFRAGIRKGVMIIPS